MTMRKWFETYVWTVRRDIVVLLIVDCTFLLVMELFLKKIPAPFPIFVKIGNLAVTLAVSFLASFIFYFVQVHMPEMRGKKNLNPVISELLRRIIYIQKGLLTEFVGVKPYENLTNENIINGTNNRDVNLQNAPLHLVGLNRNANWIEYGASRVEEIDKNWEMIMRYSDYMDSELLLLLSKIQSNPTLNFFKTMKPIYPTLRQGMHLNGFEGGMFELWHFIQKQDMYYNKHFSEKDTEIV